MLFNFEAVKVKSKSVKIGKQKLTINELTGEQASELHKESNDANGKIYGVALICAAVAEFTPGDYKKVCAMPTSVIQKLVKEISELNTPDVGN